MTLHLEFPFGIPAFETEKRFRLIEKPERLPLLFLESESTPALSFLLLPVALIDPHYGLAISPEDQAALRASSATPLMVLAVVTAGEDSPPTANLLAPVVINMENKIAVQAVRSDAVYSHRQPLTVIEASCS